jgi:hypothetical protein
LSDRDRADAKLSDSDDTFRHSQTAATVATEGNMN